MALFGRHEFEPQPFVKVKNHATGEITVLDIRPTAETRADVFFLRHASLPGEELFSDTRRELRHQQSAGVHPEEGNINDIVNETRAETEPEMREPRIEPVPHLDFATFTVYLAGRTSQSTQ